MFYSNLVVISGGDDDPNTNCTILIQASNKQRNINQIMFSSQKYAINAKKQ